jgi:recombinational DNA repair ATPase RecF
MKNLKCISYFLFFFFSLIVFAQTEAEIVVEENQKINRLRELTAQQKELLKERREILKSLRAEFKQSLTEEQQQLLKNDSMNKKERREKFMESLSETQNRTYREMCKGIQHSRGEYHQSLSKEQKEKIAKNTRKIKSKDTTRTKSPLAVAHRTVRFLFPV